MACRALRKYIALALVWVFVVLTVYEPSCVREPVYAWWGSLYPEYCFSEKAGEDLPVKISFRWLPAK